MRRLTLILAAIVFSICLAGKCQGQVKKTDTTFILSPYEKAKVEQNNEWVKQFQKQQDEFGKFFLEWLQANGIDPRRVSMHPDSLKVEPSTIFLRLKSRPK